MIGDANALITATRFLHIHERARLFLLPYLDKGLELESYQNLSMGVVSSKDIYPLVDDPNEFGQELITAALLDILNVASNSGSKRNSLVYKKNHLFDDQHMTLGDSFATDGTLDGRMVFKVSCDSDDSNDLHVNFDGTNKVSKPFDFMVNLTPKDVSLRYYFKSLISLDEVFYRVYII